MEANVLSLLNFTAPIATRARSKRAVENGGQPLLKKSRDILMTVYRKTGSAPVIDTSWSRVRGWLDKGSKMSRSTAMRIKVVSSGYDSHDHISVYIAFDTDESYQIQDTGLCLPWGFESDAYPLSKAAGLSTARLHQMCYARGQHCASKPVWWKNAGLHVRLISRRSSTSTITPRQPVCGALLD